MERERKEKKTGIRADTIFLDVVHMSAMVGPRPIFFFFFQVSREKTGKIFVVAQLSPEGPDGRLFPGGRLLHTALHTYYFTCMYMYMYSVQTHKQTTSLTLSLSRVRTAVLGRAFFFPVRAWAFFPLGGVGIISLSSFQNTINLREKRTHVAEYARPPPPQPISISFFKFFF